MNELVKAFTVYEVDGAHKFNPGGYEITIGAGGKGAATTGGTSINALGNNQSDDLIVEITKDFPNWRSLTTKSKKWGNFIKATIKVLPGGGLTVTYEPDSFAKYMASGDTK